MCLLLARRTAVIVFLSFVPPFPLSLPLTFFSSSSSMKKRKGKGEREEKEWRAQCVTVDHLNETVGGSTVTGSHIPFAWIT